MYRRGEVSSDDVRRPLTASQYVQRSDQLDTNTQSTGKILPDADVEMTDAGNNDLTNVKSSRTYQVLDEEAPGGKRDVSRDDLAKGYEYGRTAVHINETDENVTKLETQAALELVGFIPWANVSHTHEHFQEWEAKPPP